MRKKTGNSDKPPEAQQIPSAEAEAGEETGGAQRVDQWLWRARFVKSRSLAVTLIKKGGLRIAGQRVRRASRLVRTGDVLVIAVHSRLVVVRVTALAERRGPAAEAAGLYAILDDSRQQG